MLHRPVIGLEPMLPKSASGTSGAARNDGTDTPPTHGGRAKRCARRPDLNRFLQPHEGRRPTEYGPHQAHSLGPGGY